MLSLNSDQSQYSESNNNDDIIEYTIILNEFVHFILAVMTPIA